FVRARSCVPSEQGHFEPASAGTGGVSFTLQGGGRLGIVDPSGHSLEYYIAGASAWSDYGAGLDDDANAMDPVEYIQLPNAPSGDYRINAIATEDGVLGLNASTYDVSADEARSYAEYALLAGQAVRFNVHIVQGGNPLRAH